jgi:D-tyrosyl-tRNA(Tyr) deacylase
MDGTTRKIGAGLLVLAGFCAADDERTADFMAEKTANLRVFEDIGGAMNLSLLETGGECLIVPNFTLYADCRKGRRPSFINAAPPRLSLPAYLNFVEALGRAGIKSVKPGVFGADMIVELINDGPVTIILDSADIMPKNNVIKLNGEIF